MQFWWNFMNTDMSTIIRFTLCVRSFWKLNRLFMFYLYNVLPCLRDTEKFESLHKLSLPETNVSDVWIGKLLFYRIFSNLLVARLTSQEIIKRVFNTKILSFIRALNFSHCDWRDWNVPSYWNWEKKSGHMSS